MATRWQELRKSNKKHFKIMCHFNLDVGPDATDHTFEYW